MIYLIYGTDNYLIQKEINKIIESNHIDSININKYDLENINIKNIIDDAETLSLFDEKKVIIIDNCYIFTGVNKIEYSESEQDILINYINNPNPNTIIIFNVNHEKLDERKKITKSIKNKYNIIECNKIDNINQYIKKLFDDYTISNEDITFFIDRVGNNLGIIEQEINKIILYKDENKNITKEDIINLTTKNISPDIFKLIEMIISKKKKEALEIYYELIKIGEEPIKLIVMLANNIRIMYQTKELTKKGYTENDIASELNVHPYRIKLAKEKSREYSSESLLKHLKDLADLDIGIKNGTIDKNFAFELYILKI